MRESSPKPAKTEEITENERSSAASRPQSRQPAASGDASSPSQQDGWGAKTKESGGPKGPEPTRYNDWEIGGKAVDF